MWHSFFVSLVVLVVLQHSRDVADPAEVTGYGVGDVQRRGHQLAQFRQYKFSTSSLPLPDQVVTMRSMMEFPSSREFMRRGGWGHIFELVSCLETASRSPSPSGRGGYGTAA